MKRSQQPAAQKRLVAAWTHPVGVDVDVRKDDGTIVRTKTRSEPWMLCGTAVVLLDGISGGYALERVTAVRATTAREETR